MVCIKKKRRSKAELSTLKKIFTFIWQPQSRGAVGNHSGSWVETNEGRSKGINSEKEKREMLKTTWRDCVQKWRQRLLNHGRKKWCREMMGTKIFRDGVGEQMHCTSKCVKKKRSEDTWCSFILSECLVHPHLSKSSKEGKNHPYCDIALRNIWFLIASFKLKNSWTITPKKFNVHYKGGNCR